MNICRPPHNWSVSPKKAVAIQQRLALLRKETKPRNSFRYIAGVDAAFLKGTEQCIAGVVLWCVETNKVIEQHTVTAKLRFPYIPGLLTFREGPAIINVLRKLRMTPDVLMCDGQGIAHPRKCGIATHIGIIIDLPAVGCAKSRLIGDYQEPGSEKGDKSPLMDKDKVVGTVLRTRDNVKPVFISVGHKMDLSTAEQLVFACAIGYRLPEPTRLADHLVAAAKRDLIA